MLIRSTGKQLNARMTHCNLKGAEKSLIRYHTRREVTGGKALVFHGITLVNMKIRCWCFVWLILQLSSFFPSKRLHVYLNNRSKNKDNFEVQVMG